MQGEGNGLGDVNIGPVKHARPRKRAFTKAVAQAHGEADAFTLEERRDIEDEDARHGDRVAVGVLVVFLENDLAFSGLQF
ncbi:hypothetical protein D3C80_2061320 [compost metagenome]